ncbi:RDD family protein [Marinibactrum halimedae]|uniref:RDD family protein n=1 Tax=Marinibactrum halimedae TaxID=1444977 RepID=A0AA37T603_9GAMM|nr:RDD family protein [Marinibactrum halimedae]MCD9460983.1 RDD family protein [Marinibactrum halimedae]GLS28073.1 RDD family protein [Marinibactrum halimedae]
MTVNAQGPTNTPLDTHFNVETPEGIQFNAAAAGPIPRMLAYTIDSLWRGLVYCIVFITTDFLGKAGEGFFLITLFLLEWFYPVVFEVFRNGQTPGKKAFKIKVVNEDLTPVTWGNSFIRNLLRAVDILPFFYVFGLTSMTLSKHFQRLGDMAAGTVVIYNTAAPMRAPKENALEPCAPPKALTPNERRAITEFTLRSSDISESRQEELATLLKPVTDKEGEEGAKLLKSIGAWLLGHK